MTGRKWDLRVARANELAATLPFAAEGLRFYERIVSFQRSLYENLAAGNGKTQRILPPGSLRETLELFVLLPWFGSFLDFVGEISPPPLAQAAAALRAQGSLRWEELLDELWRAGEEETLGLSPTEGLLAWTFLQPYAEHLADAAEPWEADSTPSLCPRCEARPLVGVLRQLGDGAKRSLVCSLCATEWDYRRIVCPACGEEDVGKLPVYVAEELPHVRVEACDTCHHYIKTIDLTKNGRAVPVVDELAALPLSLWAAEKGYTKLSLNLLGA